MLASKTKTTGIRIWFFNESSWSILHGPWFMVRFKCQGLGSQGIQSFVLFNKFQDFLHIFFCAPVVGGQGKGFSIVANPFFRPASLNHDIAQVRIGIYHDAPCWVELKGFLQVLPRQVIFSLMGQVNTHFHVRPGLVGGFNYPVPGKAGRVLPRNIALVCPYRKNYSDCADTGDDNGFWPQVLKGEPCGSQGKQHKRQIGAVLEYDFNTYTEDSMIKFKTNHRRQKEISRCRGARYRERAIKAIIAPSAGSVVGCMIEPDRG